MLELLNVLQVIIAVVAVVESIFDSPVVIDVSCGTVVTVDLDSSLRKCDAARSLRLGIVVQLEYRC